MEKLRDLRKDREVNIAFVDWQLDIECPHCKENIDLVDYESNTGVNFLSILIFNNKWGDISGYLVECPHCHNDFNIDKVEY